MGGADRSDRSDKSDKSDRSDKSVVGTETNHTVVAWDCVPCAVKVGVAITSPPVLVARTPPSSPGPLLPPAGEGEARLVGWAGRVMLLYRQR